MSLGHRSGEMLGTDPLHDINSWPVEDECPGTALDKILPVSKRIECLIARNKTHSCLKTNFMNLQGAVEMVSGLDYHHTNFGNITAKLMLNELCGKRPTLLHEAVAYLNRLGQFYYFVKSPFVQKYCATAKSLTPAIRKHVVFRQKHSAHRSIDVPKGESEHLQVVQALTMSSLGGFVFHPKPDQGRNTSDLKSNAELVDHFCSTGRDFYLGFQLLTNEPDTWHTYFLEKEHPIIMQEAYSIFEQLLK